MDDLIRRQEALKALEWTWAGKAAFDAIKALPSAEPDINEYLNRGEWEMFELITSAWYGKQYYFKEDNGMAYSRKSHRTMTVHDAILEFIQEIGDE